MQLSDGSFFKIVHLGDKASVHVHVSDVLRSTLLKTLKMTMMNCSFGHVLRVRGTTCCVFAHVGRYTECEGRGQAEGTVAVGLGSVASRHDHLPPGV